ncbi:LolA family protein [Hirschia baltica]|uniref:Outer membrane lipoprotein carrier protein LolA n=1 Tax=Hirschia baltica (strain ATCC 49814 / DSM 5838 / IFAM 1418) TaxID=582402 RepID=C6XKC0_HIRBI|nr:outer membrane lipoprotein carrier protein LolA [Hirschia baltica]ACT57718.1 outer membrane lipoprotein carrier protein LolA [Hirschia baltica ATCC 49814]
MIIASSLIPLFIAFAAPAQDVDTLPNQQIEIVESANQAIAPAVDFQNNELLTKINARMADTKTARGGFKQTDAMGEITTGDFYLRRPGRVRFEYAAPTPYLIVSDGTTVAIEDKELDTIDRAPLSATPLKHFLKKTLNLAEDTTILDVRSLPDSHLVVIEDNPKNGDEAIDGLVFLKFSKENYDLMGWVTIDGLGNETRVDLFDMELNGNISPRLFVLEDEDNRDRR